MSKDPSHRLPAHSASTATSANAHAEKAVQVPAKEASDGALLLLGVTWYTFSIRSGNAAGVQLRLCFQPAPNTPNTRPLPS
jgi:hypothetical protein